MVLSEEVKQILRAYKVPVKRKYFQAASNYKYVFGNSNWTIK